ncbi:MAG: T9SS type A sorting domain-containing protein [Cytophagales bacterium]|nr:T9SS type A sorting domain-containing protein [Cytophagales bacterium]
MTKFQNYIAAIIIFSILLLLQADDPTYLGHSPLGYLGGQAKQEKGYPNNPGWFKQNLLMKKDSTGKIPRWMLQVIWQQQKQRLQMQPVGKNIGNLLNTQELGPQNIGGRTRALLIDVTDHSHFIAGGVSGGLWESYDKGITWQPVNDLAPTLSVTYITQDPFNPANIYYSTGEPRGNSAGIPGDGVFKSIDTGKTFIQLPATNSSAFNYIWSVKVSPTDSNTLYVGTANNGLYKSADGGNTFINVFSISGADVSDIETLPNGFVIIGVKELGIYRSSTGNSGTFIKVTSGLPANGFRRIELAYCQGFPNVLYAQFEDSTESSYWTALKGIWKSTDTGSTWTQITNPETALGASYAFPWYCFTLGVKPDDPDAVISGSVALVYSLNGGISWNYTQSSHVDNHIVVFDRDNPNMLYIGNDGGIYSYDISTINLSVIDLNNGYDVTQYYAGAHFPTGTDCFGGTQDNGTHASRSGNSLFDIIYWGDGAFTQINQQNPNISFVSWQYGHISRADNSLNTYPSFNDVLNDLDANFDGDVDDGAWFINPFEINRNDGDQLYFVTKKRIWRTTNGALTWMPLTNIIADTITGTKPYAIGISNDLDPTVYIGGQNMLFYRVNNALTAFPGDEVDLSSSIPPNLSGSFISNITVHPGNDSVIYAALSNYSTEPRIYRVINANSGSPAWIDISGDLPAYLPVNWIEAHPQSPDSFLIAATDFGLYTTVNAGTNWNHETSLPNAAIHQIRLRYTDRKLFIFTHGRGVWLADLPDLSSPPCTPPVADFFYTDSLLTVSFYDSSSNTANWLWDFDDGFSSILQNPTHIFNDGTYNVCLTAENPCSADTFCMPITVTTTGINENPGYYRNLKVYPIPAKDVLNIEINPDRHLQSFNIAGGDIKSDSYQIESIKIVNVFGQVVYQADNNKHLQIDISEFEEGLYFILIEIKDGTILRKIIISQY